MLHLRADFDAIQPFPVKRAHIVRIDGRVVNATQGVEHLGRHMDPLIPDDEPVFLLRGQDPAAWAAVLAYADQAETEGAAFELVKQTRAWAYRMRAYADLADHGAPDVPPGMLRDANHA